ncbi:MAG: SMP-30/gluconolactonase/LRE family protein [Pseudomonadales bacterium]|jgi:sugar lactone lactonase YvrE|nr:SMP-30/gluconolactonase/LRE family protein [Pseudomonadales bacterium]MDP6470082.1 SMP-30/gluconolactonase/LRE family protein [Pseudomonadales bacterium]MDP6826985.1 SMP-30/gluconolactonase/LRE family protein [Pseudomonadales bacterium]MDP6971080.1 SMP-30/gluconolactonase/LRE family protein [Pseudomonadales bacterium]|tara:strand:+ start:986 stop:1819 length:834 start_codon:yes stop_codon:yes gene_type:complete
MNTEILLDGLCFPEGPRFHDGELWFSDMHAHQVISVAPDGSARVRFGLSTWPSGLGWLPDGDLLVVSMTDRSVQRWDGSVLRLHADLSELASFHCNDMVVDGRGNAYVGNFGFDLHAEETPRPAEMILITPDGTARIVAEDLLFPNGTVITPDGDTLIVGESWGARLTAFDVAPNGELSNRRVWAELPKGSVPDGICLDEAGGIWVASPGSNECLRVEEAGKVTHRIQLECGAFACMLGGTTLYIAAAQTSDPDQCREQRSGRIETAAAPYAGAGWP